MNWLLLNNSLLVSVSAAVLATALGFAAGVWMVGLTPAWRRRFAALAIVPLALPHFLVANCWLALLGHSGTWKSWLPFDIFSLGGATWILSLLFWPIGLFATLTAWNRLEPAHLESDPALKGFTLVRALLFPIARPALAQAAFLIFVLSLSNFAVPSILQVKVWPAEVWIQFSTALDAVGALKMSWPLVIGPLVLLMLLRVRTVPWPALEARVDSGLIHRQLGAAWTWFPGIFSGILLFVSAGLPLFNLASTKRTWTELPGALAAGPSATWNSFWLAASAATVLVFLVLMFVALRPGCARPAPNTVFHPVNLLNLALWLAFLLPGVLLDLGLILAFNHRGVVIFYHSMGIMILALVIRYLALGWLGVGHSFSMQDPDLRDDARLNGASRWQLLRYVQWPQIASAVAITWYVVFLLCLWDVESILLIWPPGGETLSLRIFNMLHYGHNAQVNALCLVLLCIAIAPLPLWAIARSRHVRRRWHPVKSPGRARSPMLLAAPFSFGALLFTGCRPDPVHTDLASTLFTQVEVIGSRGVGIGQLNKPRSVAMDAQDDLYVVDMTGRVQKFSPQGAFLLSWQMPQTDLGKPKGMGRDAQGNILVIEPHYQRVNHFSPDGKLLAQWGQKGTNAGQFMLPRAIAVNSHGEIYVSEYGIHERVQRFGPLPTRTLVSAPPRERPESASNRVATLALVPTPALLNSFGRAGTAPGEFNRPEGLCVDRQDRVYVADSCNHRIQVFSREGAFLRAYGKAGTGKGQLSYPYDICVDADGHQYVCEFGNSRIQVFDKDDQPIEILGRAGADPGQFSNPWGLALDSLGNLYVADSQNHRVQKLIRKR